MSSGPFWPTRSKWFSLCPAVWLKGLNLVHTLKELNYGYFISVVI